MSRSKKALFQMSDEDTISTNDFSLIARVCRNTVVDLIKLKKLTAITPGLRNLRIRISEAKAYCKDHDIPWPKYIPGTEPVDSSVPVS